MPCKDGTRRAIIGKSIFGGGAMNGYIAFVKKEITENIRNYKTLIMIALFVIFGIFSPLSARFMSEIISSLAPDLQITLNEPTALDSWQEFYGNVSSLGMSLMLIIFCSCLSSEYSKGTLVNMLTKGLSRPAVIMGKFTVTVLIMTISYWISFVIAYGYTEYFWAGAALPHMFFAAFCLWILGIMYLSTLILGCVIFRQAFPSVLFILVVSGIMGRARMIEPLKKFNPFNLTVDNLGLLYVESTVSEMFLPIFIALIISAIFLTAAISLFNKKQV
jgi:ABC-2 type transport system permease protein